MQVDEIVDRDSLEAYLKDQPSELIGLIAARVALRVLPTLVWFFDGKSLESLAADYILSCNRAMIISSGAGTWPPDEMRASAYAATAATAADALASFASAAAAAFASSASASAYASSADSSSAAFASSADSASASSSFASSAAFASVIRADINKFLEHGLPALRDAQLWPEPQPQKLDDLWQDYKSKVLATDPNWQFWINWYDRVLAGDPQNWDMLKQVALIDSEDWDQGAVHVNGLIAGMLSDQAKASTEIGEVLTPDQVTGLLEAVPVTSRNEEFIRTCVISVESSVSRLLTKGAANEYASILDTLEILKQDIELDRGNAFSLFNAFSFAWRRIKAAVDKGIVPNPDDDAKLDRLINALDKGIADLSGSEHVQQGLKYRHSFAQDGRAEMVTADVIEYALASAKISTGVLKQQLGTDTVPKDNNETAEEKAGRELRLMSRLIRIRHYLNNGNIERVTAMLQRLNLEPADIITALGKLKDMTELIDWVLKVL